MGQIVVHHYKLSSSLFTGSQRNPQANPFLIRSLFYLSQKSNYSELWETEPCKNKEKFILEKSQAYLTQDCVYNDVSRQFGRVCNDVSLRST